MERGFNCGWGGNARLRSGVAPLFVSRAQHHLLALQHGTAAAHAAEAHGGSWGALCPFALCETSIIAIAIGFPAHTTTRTIHIGCGGEYGLALVSCQDILSSLFLVR